MVTPSRTRKRRFRVIAGPLAGQPRKRAVWDIEYDGVEHYAAVEILSEAEFAQRDSSEQRGSQLVPGVGHLMIAWVSRDEAQDIRDERAEAVALWESARGLDEVRW